jgi:hypothetical protein
VIFRKARKSHNNNNLIFANFAKNLASFAVKELLKQRQANGY